MLAQGFLRVKRSSTNHKMLLFVRWRNKYAIMSDHYLMRQQVSMVLSLHLVYLSTAACISEKIKLGPCWRKDF